MGFPFKNFDPAMVTAVNEAEQFRPRTPSGDRVIFDPTKYLWESGRTDAEGKAARDAVGLGLRITPKVGQAPVLVPVSLGPMTCLPFRDDPAGNLIEQRLFTYLSYADIEMLRHDPATGQRYELANARLVYALSPSMNDRLKAALTTHFGAGRLEPVFARGITLDRGAGTGVAEIDQWSDVNNVFQLHSWLDGNSAVWWRFANAVARADAELLTLQSTDVLTIYAEAGFSVQGQRELAWYRVNAGYVLRRLAESGESPTDYDSLAGGYIDLGVANGRQADYAALKASDRGGVVAPAETVARADLIVVNGGSLASTVLQPVGVLPPALFSFITCDEIRVFAPALASRPEVWAITHQPVVTQQDLARVWRSLGRSPERFRSNAFQEFPATRFQSELVQNQKVDHDQRFHDGVKDIVRYDVMGVGHHSGPVTGTGELRTVVPQESPHVRPDHPEWEPAPARAHQFKRLYPLRLTIGLGTAPGEEPAFTITQDTIDCARQEYVFHLNWMRTGIGLYYFQGDQSANSQMRPAEAHTRLDTTGQPRTDSGGEIPAIQSSSGRIVIPTRDQFRELDQFDLDRIAVAPRVTIDRNLFAPFISVYRPVTHLPLEWQDRLEEVRAAMLSRVLEIERVLARTVLPSVAALSSFARMVMAAFLRVLDDPAPPLTGGVTVEGVLKALYDPVFGHPDVVDAAQCFADDLATAKANLPTDVGGLLVRASSAWRPPEHNETTSSTIASNHQIGLALDIQPSLTHRDRRNPLMMLALHDVAQRNLDLTVPRLTEALLEDNRGNFLSSVFNEARALYQIAEVPPGSRNFRERLDASDPGIALPTPGPTDRMSGNRELSALAAKRFQARIDELMGASMPWPARPPTALELYLFVLSEASHVHFTFKQGISVI